MGRAATSASAETPDGAGMAAEPDTELEEALGDLGDPAERFVARVLDAALSRGWRTPDDFVQQFPADVLMRALEDASDLRTRILSEGVGIPNRIAERCSTAAATEALEIALEEGVVAASRILELIPLADRVQRFSGPELWQFCTEGFIDRASSASQRQTREVERLAVVLEAALAEQLVNLSDLASAGRLDQLAKRMPDAELRRAFALAIESALDNMPVQHDAIADLLDVRSLVEGADATELWEELVTQRIARPIGLVTSGMESIVRERSHDLESSPQLRIFPPSEGIPKRIHDDVTKRVSIEELTKGVHEDVTKRVQIVPPPEAIAKRLQIVPPSEDITIELEDEELDDATDPRFHLVLQRGAAQRAADATADRANDADRSRRAAVTEALREIGRLPRNHEYLSLPILRSIGKMYREMKSQRNKGGRAQAIKDSFDNEAHLRVGLLALIELIDPHLDPSSVHEAGSDVLVDILLAQERALWQKAKARGNVKPGSEPLRGRLPPPPPRR